VLGWVAAVTHMTEFREARQRLAKVERPAAAGQLPASLGHEISNPLNAVTNCLYLLQKGDVDGQTTKSLLDAASNELARVGRIVRQSLSYYRVGAMAQTFDMAVLIRDSVHIFSEKFKQSAVQVKVKVKVKVSEVPTLPCWTRLHSSSPRR